MTSVRHCKIFSPACEEPTSAVVLASWLNIRSLGGWTTDRPSLPTASFDELTRKYFAKVSELSQFILMNETGPWCFPALLLSLFQPLRFADYDGAYDTLHTLNQIARRGRSLILQIRQVCDYTRYSTDVFRMLHFTPTQLLYTFWMNTAWHDFGQKAASMVIPMPLPDFPCSMHATGKVYVDRDGTTPTIRSPLVLDLGSNFGQDTFFYLSMGYRVVAVDVNPYATKSMNRTFATFVATGTLIILNGAIESTDAMSSIGKRFRTPKVPICIQALDEHTSIHSQDDKRSCVQNRWTDVISCSSLLKKFGKVYYMKIDVESNPDLCTSRIESLPWAERPRYISLETPLHNMTRFRFLHSIGYTKYKVVGQHAFYQKYRPLGGGSGLFGEDAVDILSGLQWRSTIEIAPSVAQLYYDATRLDWIDVHLKLHAEHADE